MSTAPEPTREDRYEAAVRAVLDLCDEAEHYGTIPGGEGVDGLVDPEQIRAAVRAALLPSEEPVGPPAPVVAARPGGGQSRPALERIVRGPGLEIRIESSPAYRAELWPK